MSPTVAQLVESAYRTPTPSAAAPSSCSIRALLDRHGFNTAALSTEARRKWQARCQEIREYFYSRSCDRRRAYKRADLAYFGQCLRGK